MYCKVWSRVSRVITTFDESLQKDSIITYIYKHIKYLEKKISGMFSHNWHNFMMKLDHVTSFWKMSQEKETTHIWKWIHIALNLLEYHKWPFFVYPKVKYICHDFVMQCSAIKYQSSWPSEVINTQNADYLRQEINSL